MGNVESKIDLSNVVFAEKAALKYGGKNHAGHIVESIIRKKGHNISKLAQNMKISRCTLYNWFQQEALPFDILVRIGAYINHDFSVDFPEYFSLNMEERRESNPLHNQILEDEKVDFWRHKYILLLEKYNEYLLCLNNKPK